MKTFMRYVVQIGSRLEMTGLEMTCLDGSEEDVAH